MRPYDCLRYTEFLGRWSNKFPQLVIESKALDGCDYCYIFCNCYKSLKQESYEKPDDSIDDYDYDDDDDDDNYAVDGDGKNPYVITDIKLEVKIHNTQKQSGMSFHHINKESKLMICSNDSKTKQSRKR